MEQSHARFATSPSRNQCSSPPSPMRSTSALPYIDPFHTSSLSKLLQRVYNEGYQEGFQLAFHQSREQSTFPWHDFVHFAAETPQKDPKNGSSLSCDKRTNHPAQEPTPNGCHRATVPGLMLSGDPMWSDSPPSPVHSIEVVVNHEASKQRHESLMAGSPDPISSPRSRMSECSAISTCSGFTTSQNVGSCGEPSPHIVESRGVRGGTSLDFGVPISSPLSEHSQAFFSAQSPTESQDSLKEVFEQTISLLPSEHINHHGETSPESAMASERSKSTPASPLESSRQYKGNTEDLRDDWNTDSGHVQSYSSATFQLRSTPPTSDTKETVLDLTLNTDSEGSGTPTTSNIDDTKVLDLTLDSDTDSEGSVTTTTSNIDNKKVLDLTLDSDTDNEGSESSPRSLSVCPKRAASPKNAESRPRKKNKTSPSLYWKPSKLYEPSFQLHALILKLSRDDETISLRWSNSELCWKSKLPGRTLHTKTLEDADIDCLSSATVISASGTVNSYLKVDLIETAGSCEGTDACGVWKVSVDPSKIIRVLKIGCKRVECSLQRRSTSRD